MLWAHAQALEEERLGPRREAYSDERCMRLAVQEGATALVCSLLPAIEPVVLVRIALVWVGYAICSAGGAAGHHRAHLVLLIAVNLWPWCA